MKIAQTEVDRPLVSLSSLKHRTNKYKIRKLEDRKEKKEEAQQDIVGKL